MKGFAFFLAMLACTFSYGSDFNALDFRDGNFYFGVATAPAHVEDQLDDIWLDFADQGGVRAFFNTPKAEERLRFWTHPEEEIRLVKESGVKKCFVWELIGGDWFRTYRDQTNVRVLALWEFRTGKLSKGIVKSLLWSAKLDSR